MDMVGFLRYKGIDVYSSESGYKDKHVRRNSDWVHMRCPICGGDKLWLGYNTKKHFFNCWNHGGSTKQTLLKAWFPSLNAKTILASLSDTEDIVRIEEVDNSDTYQPPTPQHSLKVSPFHSKYIMERGLDPEYLGTVWGVTALDYDAEIQYRARLFFPVYEINNPIPVSWLTRTVLEDEVLRYLNAPPQREAKPIKSVLYGEQMTDYYRPIVVCEGVFDAFAIGKGAVATLGKKVTQAQLERIGKYLTRYICFDAERDTQEQAMELADKLSIYPGITNVVCLDAPDPATAPQHELDLFRKTVWG